MSESNSYYLWPRHEVFQLMMPHYPLSGRHLQVTYLLEAVRQLAKMQSQDRSISFEQWFAVARDILKWTEYTIRIFWDMLHTASWYRQNIEWAQHSDFVNIGHLIVFLVMHCPVASRPNSPRTSYDTVWPTAEALASPPSSPVINNNRKMQTQPSQNSAGTPLSPRSQVKDTPVRISRRSSPPFWKCASQHVQMFREKLSIMLKALSLQDSVTLEHEDTVDKSRHSEDSNEMKTTGNFSCDISMTSIDALGLILGGGYSRNREVSNISSLYPFWPQDDNDDMNFKLSSISYSDAIEWIEARLALNEVRYPACQIPASPQSTSESIMEAASNDSTDSTSSSNTSTHPVSIRKVFAFKANSTLQSLEPPTTIMDSVGTFIHVNTMDNTPSLVKNAMKSNSNDSLLNQIIKGSKSTKYENKFPSSLEEDSQVVEQTGLSRNISTSSIESLEQFTEGLSPLDYSNIALTSPPLFIIGCHRSNIYMLGVYSCCNITGCYDSEVIIGAVGGVVVVSGCERIHLTVTCRKLIISNCHEITFQIGTLSPIIITGTSRNLIFGPYNTAYRLLRSHLRFAGLGSLMTGPISPATKKSPDCNYWNWIYDASSLAESPQVNTFSTNSTHSVDDIVSSGLANLPRALDAVASIQHPSKFSFVGVPYASEYQPLELCPIKLPEEYSTCYNQKKVNASNLQKFISATLGAASPEAETHFTNAFNQKFLDWLNKSGKSAMLTDLIKMDAEDASLHEAQDQNSTPKNEDSSPQNW